MNILLWVLQILAALLFGASGVMFVWVHVQYGEIPPIILSGVLGIVMAFIAYGRMVVKPIVAQRIVH